MPKKNKLSIAYFSMEFALDDKIPNFAGGLGVLAADAIYSAADLELPLVGISLLYHINDDPKTAFRPDKLMQKCPQTITIHIEGRPVKIVIWKKDIKGRTGKKLPIYFLSSYCLDNDRHDRDLTKRLYSGDAYIRLAQEAILGIGGVRALQALGYDIKHYHLNEGHSALLTLEKLKECGYDIEVTRHLNSFTTHTAVSSGHDYFDYELTRKLLGTYLPDNIQSLSLPDRLGMTELALNLSGKANAVSRIHQQVCMAKFPGYKFEYITNGIYHNRWVGTHIKKLLDKQIPDWQSNPEKLSTAINLPPDKLKAARQAEKKDFINWLNRNQEYFPLNNITVDDNFSTEILTIGFARRLVPYKRADLIFRDLERLRHIGKRKLQLVFAGNCYEGDFFSNNLVAKIKEYAKNLRYQVKIALIPEYNLQIGKRLVSGCDVWLNNPIPGFEASGTSGMKAALNGVPNLSSMDGWWIEAYKNDVRSGWGFGEFIDGSDRDQSDHNQLMQNLENVIDCYYNRPEEWHEKVSHSIALVSFFNTHRMIKEYKSKMWK